MKKKRNGLLNINLKHKKKKGTALLWVLIIVFTLLIIAGSLSGLIIKEMRMSVNIDLSEQAYAAARSGIDIAQSACNDLPLDGFQGEINGVFETDPTTETATVSYKINKFKKNSSGECRDEATNKGVESEGIVDISGNQISRKLSAELNPVFQTSDVIEIPDGIGTIDSIGNFSYFKDTGSRITESRPGAEFYQVFDLSVPSNTVYVGTGYIDGTPQQIFLVGINPSGGSPGPSIEFWKRDLTLLFPIDAIGYPPDFPPFFEGLDSSADTVYRVKIAYRQGKMEVVVFERKTNPDNLEVIERCVATGSVDFPNYTFNNFVVYSSAGVIINPENKTLDASGAQISTMVFKYY